MPGLTEGHKNKQNKAQTQYGPTEASRRGLAARAEILMLDKVGGGRRVESGWPPPTEIRPLRVSKQAEENK